MKKTLIALVLLLTPLHMCATFGAATAWDVRTTGLDTNGGAFDSGVGSPGTNESLGSGVAITVTLTATTTGTGSPAFSSTTHGPGNFVHIASGTGCTVGWYEVLSQAAGVATFDHAMGSTTNVCVGTIGGSLLTVAQAVTVPTAGNFIWIQSGTYTTTATTTIAVNASITLEGYQTTHGDYGTRPLITTATNSTDLITDNTSSAVLVSFIHLSLSNTAGTRSSGVIKQPNGSSGAWVFSSDILDGFTEAINADNFGATSVISYVYISGTEIKNCTPAGGRAAVFAGIAGLYISGSYLHNITGLGISSMGTTTIFEKSIAASISAGVLASGVRNIIDQSTFYNNGGSVINPDSAGNTLLISNSIFYSNASTAINSTVGTLQGTAGSNASRSNAFGSNGTNYSGTWLGSRGDVTLTANPFTNAGAGDFSLNTTAGGGAALKGAGYPGAFPGATSTGNVDIGAVQSAGGSSAGGNFGSSN